MKTDDQLEEMKRAFVTQLRDEDKAGYQVVRSPLPEDDPMLCHACNAAPFIAFAPMFERDPSVMQSYLHVAKVCAACKDDQEQVAKLGDRIAAHGKQLFEKYGDAVVVPRGPVPSA